MDTNSIIPIIILNWNSFADTQECVSSILTGNRSRFHIYLLDNGSAKEDVNVIKKTYLNHPNITLRFYDTNLGFAKAHNLIFNELIQQDFKYIFVLNNDTYTPKESLDYLLSNSFTEPKGMLAFKMINYWDRNIMDNAGHRMLSTGEIIPVGHGDSISIYNEPFENMGACAGATLYSLEMLSDIGFFDDYFETGYEDAELGLRAIIAGYPSIYEPQLVVYHKMGQSIKKVFNYDYTLKIQTNIFYTYLKLVHWQVFLIQFIPLTLRFMAITIIDILFWRPKYLKIQYHALYNIIFKDFGKVLEARKKTKSLRRISWWKLLSKQEFSFRRDIFSFYKFIIKGEKSYFEKY